MKKTTVWKYLVLFPSQNVLFFLFNHHQPTLDENVYGFGKQVARLAQLAHIASVLEDKDSAIKQEKQEDSLTVSLTKVLHSYLSAYLRGQIRDKLLYDTNFGGIVSTNGLKDFMDDFGNGW